jgi:ATP-dependent helicase/nuclease subunit B
LAAEWLATAGDPLAVARGMILLPTRRAARSLAEAFLRASGGRPLLLPRITAVGALDEAPLTLAGALDLPPAAEPAQRLAALTQLILAMRGADGAPRTADRAWMLATDLAALMDDAERAEIDLAERLPEAADPAYAAHWARTLEFLHIVTRAWPNWLAEQGLMNPAARQVALLNAQTCAWEAKSPEDRVLVAGTTGGIPAVARLLRVVARLPHGAVVLPGLDTDMAEEVWSELDDAHPQAGLALLLHRLGASRDDVRPWRLGLWGAAGVETGTGTATGPGSGLSTSLPLPLWEGAGGGVPTTNTGVETPLPLPPPTRGGASHHDHHHHDHHHHHHHDHHQTDPNTTTLAARATSLRRAMLPAGALASWRDAAPTPIDGLSLLTTADQQEEAAAIALVLREALESPGAQAALVTPDRDLAGRVSTELLRYGVVADDSAGEKLSDSPPAVFLRLLVSAVAEELAPVPLLALLKHPMAAAGLAPSACRAAARALELACLRGPRPSHGLPGLRRAVDRGRADPAAAALLSRLEACLEPTLRIAASVEVAPAEAMAALVEAAEHLAATDEFPGPSRLWAGEEGEALATRLAEVQAALPLLPDQRRAVLPGLLDAVLEGAVVRSRRALRGRDGTEHPRVFIWGLLEARLQTADVMVLGGLAEGVWPSASDPGPWLSRPMRVTVGLPSPEEVVGQAAHDFVACACAAPVVVLSCPRRRDGAPVVPARWLTRLETLLAGQGIALPRHPAAAWVRALDHPVDGPTPVRPPRPCPPVALRPRKLSVTEIETWLRDPYAIHARHVLKLEALKPLDEATDAADYGSLVHAGLNHFLEQHGIRWPADAGEQLRRAMLRALQEAGLREALAAWWAPRLGRIADWVADIEVKRRSERAPVALSPEVRGTQQLVRSGGLFELRGRADRIERRHEGGLAILDYKTGTPPTQKEVDAGLAPQLLLEAAMAEAGAFGPGLTGVAEELTYWHLTGGFHPGELRTLFKGKPDLIAAAVADARDALCRLIDAYDAPDRCYLSQPQPGFAPRFSDYTQLARVAEWAAAGDDA